jgi:diacylglycerol kinase family enzyme
MRLALIANERSGGGLAPESLAIALRVRGAEVERFSLDDREAAAEGSFERIVVAGGDGSVGCAAELAGRLDVPLAVIAAGTANDFARAHDLELDLERSLELAVRGQKLETLELGYLGDRPFVNVVSAGLSPTAARLARPHKKRLGALAYIVGAVHAGLTAHPVPCRVRVDDATLHNGPAWQIIVSVSGAFGGGSSVDDADPGDGALHVTVIPAGSRLRLLPRAIGLRRGDVTDQAGVVEAEGTRVDLGLAPGTDVNLDGELCAPAPLTVTPRAFRLVVG